MTDVIFPRLSLENSDATGVVATWFARDREPVQEGELIAEVQMDKVDVEIDAPVSGTLVVLVSEGAEVTQGAVIAVIE